ncbi:hypothetical protein PSY51_23665, partial [Shigella flexneri]|nr:hypothetical protein [Shigella flexneri]
MHIPHPLHLLSPYHSLPNPLTSLPHYLPPPLISL